MADEPSNLLAVHEGIQRCAEAAADSIVAHAPGLSRDRIKARVAYELWLAITDITDAARIEGAMA